MACWSGLDVLHREDFARLHGKSIGLVCNQASVTTDFQHILDLLVPLHQEGRLRIASVMGPQHGLFGHTQDNMIEWEGAPDRRTSLPVHSLYGKHREPTDAMLEGVELLVIDIFDVGSRYYTFIWTMSLCIKACAERGIPVLILDRANPIGGEQVEGTLLQSGYESFVGLRPLPTRHGMTAGEIAAYLKDAFYPSASVSVVGIEGWNRSRYSDEIGAAWAMPSPNMPTVDTAVVYPGGCLLEGTNLSEGRGTTRPFEIFGAPYLDGWEMARSLNSAGLAGVTFRPLEFQPTFQKHAGARCGGCFVHVTDRRSFEPVLAYVAIMREARVQAGDDFKWNPPPYEYEEVLLPIDILAGNDWLRLAIDAGKPLTDIRDRFQAECQEFSDVRKSHLFYNAS